MRFIQNISGAFLLIVVSLTACGTESPPVVVQSTETPILSTPETSTQEATSQPDDATVQATPELNPTTPATETPSIIVPAPTATNRAVSTATPLPPPPTPVFTSTPEPAPIARINEKVTKEINVRAGPGTNYSIIDDFDTEEIAIVTGRNAANTWWQVNLEGGSSGGWVYARLVQVTGNSEKVAVVDAPPPPTSIPETEAVASGTEGQTESTPANPDSESQSPSETAPQPESPTTEEEEVSAPSTPAELTDELRCDKDFCVTYQTMVSMAENGGCIGNHSIYVTVLEGPPPGKPMDNIVIGDTFNNIEVGSGSKGPGRAEVTLWMNSMSLKVKRHMDGTEYSSEESFAFTSHDELIPAEVLAANGYCDGNVETCRVAQNNNQVCRGHYSWRVTFHKFD